MTHILEHQSLSERFSKIKTASLDRYFRSQKLEQAFYYKKKAMKTGLEGALPPSFYVFSADCGLGKGASTQSFIKEWKGLGFPGEGSMLLILPTLHEIDNYIERSKLEGYSYSVCVGDQGYRRRGLGIHNSDKARVLFTTHSKFMLLLSQHDLFADIKELTFNGGRRSLVICDEGIDLIPHATFTLDALYALPDALKESSSELADMVRSLFPSRDDLADGGSIELPARIRELANNATFKSGVTGARKAALEGLRKLAGSTAYLRNDPHQKWMLLGAGKALPADLAPMIIMDASARLIRRYEGLRHYGANVVQMMPAKAEFDPLTIRVWDQGCGKATLRKAEDRSLIFRVIANLINSNPGERWVVVFPKSARQAGEGDQDLPTDLAVLIDDPALVSALHWGLHLGTNDFRECRNVIILGDHSYGEPAYIAKAMARLNVAPADITKEDIEQEQEEAFAHDQFQEICRSNVRNYDDGLCGSANAYLVMPEYDRAKRVLVSAFPGANVERWKPETNREPTKNDSVQRVLLALFKTSNIVSLKDVREACGAANDKSYLIRILKTQEFKEYMEENGIRRIKNHFIQCRAA